MNPAGGGFLKGRYRIMKRCRITFAAALLALALLLMSCASGGNATTEEKAFSETDAVRLTETANLMETLQQVEAAFQDNSASTLFDADSGHCQQLRL